MASAKQTGSVLGEQPDPGQARTMREFIAALSQLKTYSGDPSITVITKRIHRAWRASGRPDSELPGRATVGRCFQLDRPRPNEDLILAVVEALRPDPRVVTQWRQAFRILRGEAKAASFVQAQSTLPDDIAQFTGRESELARLASLLDRSTARAAVVISAIEGMAGIGKTQLAVHAGRGVLSEFGIDQILFVNLRGFHEDPAQPPADPAAVLDSFLRLLNVPGHDVPHGLEQRAKLFRQRMRDRRALIVLDNAADAAQVRPLLPDSPRCLTLITSRRTLFDLPNADHLLLDVFTPDEALDFLRRTIGVDRVTADTSAAMGIIRECGYLPLALSIVTARVLDVTRSDWSLADHHRRLAQRRRELKVDDRVEIALSLSYHDLQASEQRLFRLLSLHPGPVFTAYAAAALAGTDVDVTHRQLTKLLEDHLLEQRASDRYELHDLVRTYAAARATDDDADAARGEALTRLVEHYLHTATVAMNLMYPHEQNRRPRISVRATATTANLSSVATARHWLDTERANLLAIATHPTSRHAARNAAALSETLHHYLLTGAHYPDARALHQHAISTAQHYGDRAGQAAALDNLGTMCWRTSQYQQATDHHQQALVLFRELDDRSGQARALNNLGIVHWRTCHYERSGDQLRQALALFRDVDDQDGQARALGNLGIVCLRTGQYQEAADHFTQTLSIFESLGDRPGQAQAETNLGIASGSVGQYEQAAHHFERSLNLCLDLGDRDGQAHTHANLGALYEKTGEYEQAIDHFEKTLTLCRDLGDRYSQAHSHTNLGSICRRTGQHEQATDHHRRALKLFRELDDPGGQAEALNGLGETARTTLDLTQALAFHAEALQHANAIGDRYQLANSYAGLGHTYHDLDQPDQARVHWQQAVTLYEELGVPEAEAARDHLAVLDVNDQRGGSSSTHDT